MTPASRGRRIAVSLLVIVGCVLAPLSVVAIWTRNTLLDTDQYVSTVGPLATDPAVVTAAAGLVTHEIVSSTDVRGRLAEGLPRRIKFAAPAIASGLEQVVHRATLRILESPHFATVWERANRRAHEQVTALLTGSGAKAFSTSDGQVLVNLTPVVGRVRHRLDQLGIDAFDNVDATRVSPSSYSSTRTIWTPRSVRSICSRRRRSCCRSSRCSRSGSRSRSRRTAAGQSFGAGSVWRSR